MSNIIHSIKKGIKKNSLRFDSDMYTETLGSLIISTCILTGDKYDTVKINKTYRNLVKHPGQVDFWIDDKDFIDKTLALFDMERPEDFPIAMVQSNFNVLFMPYVDGQLFPLREDGVFPMTASKGKIYPIDFNLTNNKDGELAAKSEVINNGEGQTQRN